MHKVLIEALMLFSSLSLVQAGEDLQNREYGCQGCIGELVTLFDDALC
jgi:hypothetical protein